MPVKFDKPAGPNPIDQGKVVGKAHDRVEGPLKVSGKATYAYEWHDVTPKAAYGYIMGSAVAKGRIKSMKLDDAKASPGVLAIVNAANAGPLNFGTTPNPLLGGPEVIHYHQAVALVVAETFEQARAAAALVKIDYDRADGQFDLEAAKASAYKPERMIGGSPDLSSGDFAGAFAASSSTVDVTYTTADEAHAMMEPFATLAEWKGDQLTLWTSNQMVEGCRVGVVNMLGMPKDKLRVLSPFVGGGFGGKLQPRADALLAALGARAVGRPVKVTITRPQMFNNSQHRAATIQRIRLGAGKDGKLLAQGHENIAGDLKNGRVEAGVRASRGLYAATGRMSTVRQAVLDLPEAGALRAPGDAPGSAAFECAIDEMANKLGVDPVEFRIINDTQTDPDNKNLPFSQRKMVECLKRGAAEFGWSNRGKPGSRREGEWLIGTGVAVAYRGSRGVRSAAHVRLETNGRITVETDMTDIGTGSYTILAQTAAEMLGVNVSQVDVKLGDSLFPTSSGSGGQFGATSSTSGVFAAADKLRSEVATKLGLNPVTARFEGGKVIDGAKSIKLATAAKDGAIAAEEVVEYGAVQSQYNSSTFGAHFVEVAVNAYTAETRVRRTLSVCSAGRIINPKAARSQVIGAMTMGIGAALSEELVVDKRFGLFINHDFSNYEIPVHADIPKQDVIFLDEPDPVVSPMKAKGIAELGICGAAAAVANAVFNATGQRVRNFPLTPDKLINGLSPA